MTSVLSTKKTTHETKKHKKAVLSTDTSKKTSLTPATHTPSAAPTPSSHKPSSTCPDAPANLPLTTYPGSTPHVARPLFATSWKSTHATVDASNAFVTTSAPTTSHTSAHCTKSTFKAHTPGSTSALHSARSSH